MLCISCRFAQFFLCPLFNEDATDREVNAIESGKNMSFSIVRKRSFIVKLRMIARKNFSLVQNHQTQGSLLRMYGMLSQNNAI